MDPYQNGLPEKQQQQLADRYAELMYIFHKKRDKIHRVIFWGLHDGMSWKNDYPIQARTNYPLLYDRDKQPKKAVDAIMNVPKNE